MFQLVTQALGGYGGTKDFLNDAIKGAQMSELEVFCPSPVVPFFRSWRPEVEVLKHDVCGLRPGVALTPFGHAVSDGLPSTGEEIIS